MRVTDLGKLMLSVVICLAVGGLGSLATRESIAGWYAQLNKPPLNPPNWVFGPVWTVLYVLMGVAAFLVWRRGLSDRVVRGAMTAFVVQLVLNALWTPLFFGLHRIGLALTEIVLLWAAILVTILLFKRVSGRAAMLLVPYLLWVSFAMYLNAAYFWLNR